MIQSDFNSQDIEGLYEKIAQEEELIKSLEL